MYNFNITFHFKTLKLPGVFCFNITYDKEYNTTQHTYGINVNVNLKQQVNLFLRRRLMFLNTLYVYVSELYMNISQVRCKLHLARCLVNSIPKRSMYLWFSSISFDLFRNINQ